MTLEKQIAPKTLYELCSKFRIDPISPLLFGLFAIYQSASTYVLTVDELVNNEENGLLVPHLLWIKEAADRLLFEAQSLQSAFSEDLLDNIESNEEEEQESEKTDDSSIKEETYLRQVIEKLLFKKKETINASLLANQVAEIHGGCKKIVQAFHALPGSLTVEVFEDGLWDIYGELYYHLVPNHLTDMVNEPTNGFNPGLSSTLIYFLDEI